MSNRYYNENGRGPLTNVTSGAKPGTSMPESLPIKTANWPGLPGQHGPDRSCGTPRQGSMGPFYVHSEMSPKQTASAGAAGNTLGGGQRFKQLTSKLAQEPGVTNPAGLAASIGRKKYGNAKMAQLSAKGEK